MIFSSDVLTFRTLPYRKFILFLILFFIFHVAAGERDQVPEQGRGGNSWVCFPWKIQDLSCAWQPAGTWLWHSLMHRVQTAQAVECRDGG